MAYLGLDVLRQHEHADLGVFGPDRLSSDKALVRVCRWHPDVDEDDVWKGRADEARQVLCVFYLGDDVDTGFTQESHEALPGEHRVVCNNYTHGNSALRLVGCTLEGSTNRSNAVRRVNHRRIAAHAAVLDRDAETSLLLRRR